MAGLVQDINLWLQHCKQSLKSSIEELAVSFLVWTSLMLLTGWALCLVLVEVLKLLFSSMAKTNGKSSQLQRKNGG